MKKMSQKKRIITTTAVLLFLLSSVFAGAVSAGWPMLYQNNENNRVDDTPSIMVPDLYEPWTVSTSQSPIIQDGKLYTTRVVDGNPEVICIDQQDGSIVWTIPELRGTLTINGEKLYLRESAGIYCFELATGEELWNNTRSEIGQTTDSKDTVTVASGKVYSVKNEQSGSSQYGYVVCLDAETGAFLWESSAMYGAFDGMTPAVANGRVYVTTNKFSRNREITCLDAETGDELWDYYSTQGSFVSPPVLFDDNVYAMLKGFYSGGVQVPSKIICFDGMGDGEGETTILWTYDILYSPTIPPIVTEDSVYYSEFTQLQDPTRNQRYMGCINRETQEQQWYVELEAVEANPIQQLLCALTPEALYVPSGRIIYNINPINGTINWIYEVDTLADYIGPITVDGTDIYTLSESVPELGDPILLRCLRKNRAPTMTEVEVPELSRSNTPIEFSATAEDVDGQELMYYFDWGDGTNSYWIPADATTIPEGETFTTTHSYDEPGVYTVRVKAKDSFDYESEWMEISVHVSNFNVDVRGGMGVTVTIQNVNDDDTPGVYTDVEIDLVGGTIPGFHINKHFKDDRVYVDSNSSAIVNMPVFALGRFNIDVTVNSAGKPLYSESHEGTILFFYVILQ